MKKKILKVLLCLFAINMTSIVSPKFVYAKDKSTICNKEQRVKTSKYTFSELSKLDNNKLVETISKIKWNDISDFMQYNAGAQKFYSDPDRIQFLINALIEKGSKYTIDDNKGIPTIIEVLRGGFYLGFYNDGLKYLNTVEYKSKCIPAIIAIENNPCFKLGNNLQNEIVNKIGLLISNTTCNAEVVNKLVPILKQYNSDINNNLKIQSKGQAIYSVLNGVSYSIESYVSSSKKDIKYTDWYRNIDGFIDEVAHIALLGNPNKQNSWLIDNGIYYVGRFAKLHSDSTKCQKVTEDALKLYPYLGQQYFAAITSMQSNFNSTYLDGTKININDIKEKGKKHYLPKKYSFDNGSIIIKAGDKITQDKIKRLYWASKEVKAQFHRVIGNDKALDKNHPDDVLTIIIYNNPKEYKLNTQLYGYSTENGGIYIENVGTFFTYERTKHDSIFSLEELFRHEFTHYLQGRYLVPGMWGQSDFYKGNSCRLTWFEEGTAEFFAGSTRENNILPRKSEVRGLAYNPAKRFSVKKLLHSKYGSFDFYNYGFAMSSYMYNHDINAFNNISKYIKNNDVKGYENYIEQLSSDKNLEVNYQKYMQELVDKYNKLTTPLVSDDYMIDHPNKNKQEVYSDIKNVSGLKDIKVKEKAGQFFNTFTLRGKFVGDVSQGKIKDWQVMNQKSNNFLKQLDKYNWSGYKTLTCYFVNYRVNSDNKFEYDVVFHGILTDKVKKDDLNNDPTQEQDNKINLALNKQVSGNLNKEDHKTYYFKVEKPGKINILLENKDNVNMNWLLYNSNNLDKYIAYPSTSGKNINGEFNVKEPGIYSIVVYKYSGENGNYNLEIKQDIKPNEVYETEDNNSFEKANKILLGYKVHGQMDKKDDADIFAFDVLEDKQVDISLKNLNNSGVNWIVYSADDINNSVSYPATSGKVLSNKFKAKKGKYYLYVYRVGENKAQYEFNIK